MRSIRRVLLLAALTALIVAASAQATTPLTIHGGLYGAKETLVEQKKSAAVDAIVIDRGKRAELVGIACSSGPAPVQGIMRETTLTVHIPGTLAISHGGSFSYSGVVTLTAEDTQSGVTATSDVTIKGQFSRGRIVKDKTIALKGTISASVCDPATPTTFSLVWATSSTAT